MDTEQFEHLESEIEEDVPNGDWTGKPAVPASTVDATNTSTRGMFVEVTGGTVTAVKVDAVIVGSRVAGMFYVRPGSTISLTYSAAPTWQWFSA